MFGVNVIRLCCGCLSEVDSRIAPIGLAFLMSYQINESVVKHCRENIPRNKQPIKHAHVILFLP